MLSSASSGTAGGSCGRATSAAGTLRPRLAWPRAPMDLAIAFEGLPAPRTARPPRASPGSGWKAGKASISTLTAGNGWEQGGLGSTASALKSKFASDQPAFGRRPARREGHQASGLRQLLEGGHANPTTPPGPSVQSFRFLDAEGIRRALPGRQLARWNRIALKVGLAAPERGQQPQPAHPLSRLAQGPGPGAAGEAAAAQLAAIRTHLGARAAPVLEHVRRPRRLIPPSPTSPSRSSSPDTAIPRPRRLLGRCPKDLPRGARRA